MYGVTTQDIVNANGVTIRKGEKVECLLISKIADNKYEGLFVSEFGVKFLSDFSNVLINVIRRK